MVKEETLTAFLEAFGEIGHKKCANPDLQDGIEKVAIYAKENRPTHGARQMFSSYWTSKLGESFDVEHELSALEGSSYGDVAIILTRPASN